MILFVFYLQPQEEFHQSIPLTTQKTKRISFKDEKDMSLSKDDLHQKALISEVQKNPVRVNRATVSEYTPKVHVIADYIM